MLNTLRSNARPLRFAAVAVFAVALFSASQSAGQSVSPLRSGPMIGYVEMMEANIWLQTKKAEKVELLYWNLEKPDEKFRSAPVKTGPDNSYIATFKLRHLESGKEYMYEVLVGGKKQTFTYVTRFKTQVHWQSRSEPPNFTFAIGSCLFINDKPFDRPNELYGGDYEILTTIKKHNPELMMWLGDNIYLRDPEFYSRDRMDYRYAYTRSIPEIQPLLGTTINIAAWDDHDFGPNDSDRSFRNKTDALDLFKKYWLNPAFGEETNPGIYFRYQYNDIEFFILDDRYHRAPNRSVDSLKPYWGEAQLQWLKDALSNSNATFKFIVNGNQIINAYSTHESPAATYKSEFNKFMTWLRAAKIDGIVFLSGDRHHTELLKMDREGAYPLFEYTSSPLTSKVYTDIGKEANNPLRVEKTLVNDRRNFGLIRVEGTRKNRVLTLQAFDVKGDLLWDYTLEAEKLRHPKQ